MPEKVTTDQYCVYPYLLEEISPESIHRTNKFLNNSLERDQQRVKKWLKIMRGLMHN